MSDTHFAPKDETATPAPCQSGKRFYVLVGIPGSGKSTYAKLFLPKALRISLDDLRLMLTGQTFVAKLEPLVAELGRASAEAVAGYAAAQGYDVVFDATNVTPQRRKPLIDLARRFGLSPVGIYVPVPLEIAQQRNRDRPEPVPPAIVASFFGRLIPPTLVEGFDEIMFVDATAPGAQHDRITSVERRPGGTEPG